MRIGVLSFHFYNSTAEGLATAKLTRALTDRGHTVTVFTSLDNPLVGSPFLNSEGPLSGITIHRVGNDPDLVPRWWTAIEKRVSRNSVWDKVGAVPNLVYGCRLQEWAWARNVAREVVRVWNSKDSFDVLHTRLNHHISHLAGLEVTRQIPQLPWCAYFSDPWPYHLYPEPYHFTVGPASRRRSEMFLNRILTRAGSYVFPSVRLRDHLLVGKRARFLKKAFVAPHLTNLWGAAGSPDTDGILKIRHSGFLMRERNIEPLFEGLRAFFAHRPDARNRMCIEFAGRYHGNGLPPAPPDLSDVVRFHPHMDPASVWDWLQRGNIFLLVEAKMKEGIFLASKLADYLGGNRPILALSPVNGVTADYLRNGGGILVPPDDVDGIKRALTRFYDLWQSNRLTELEPSREQVELVSPDKVIPVYEQAFEAAMSNAGC